MLEKLRSDLAGDTLWKNQDQYWVVIRRKEPGLFTYDVDFGAEHSASLTLQAEDEVLCSYAVNLKMIANVISTKIDSFAFTHRRVEKGEKKKRSNKSKR